jgi:hypothetical protein
MNMPAPTLESIPKHLDLLCQADVTIEASEPQGQGESVPRFAMLAYSGGPMRVEGWKFPVVVDLHGLAIPSQRRPVRFGHSMFAGVGHTERIAVEDGRLMAEGIVSRDTAAAREVVTSGKRGFPWQASIGARVVDAQFVKAGGSAVVNGRSIDGPVYVARKTVLGEISFVDLGADGNTAATIAASQEGNSMDETQVTSQTAATEGSAEHPAVEAAGTEAGSIAATQPVDAVAEIRAQALAETQRIGSIRRICKGSHADIEARAIGEGWTTDKCELEVLRASRPKAPALHVVDHSLSGRILEAACFMTGKLTGVEEIYDDQTLEAASKRFRGDMGLQELLLEAAWANGYTGRNFRDSRAVLRFAFGHDIQAAGLSTIDIGGILSNVSNKFLLEGFFSVERTWRNICAVRNVSDFKTVTSYRLIGKDQYELVAPGGELKHGTLGEETFSNKADTHGLMLSIDRRDIINDDLGAITAVPRKLGRGSGSKINDVFWTIFLSNSTFFIVGRNNYFEGADTVLSVNGLTQAERLFMDQVDADGKPTGIMPAILLVPTSLSALATTLQKSLEIRDTTANKQYPIANPHAGKFRTEVSRYLANAQYTGNSATGWYLLAEPNDLPVIEVAFLNGQESPTIETADADFKVLGIQMRGYHDFGVALQDPRGGVKSKGAA